MNIDLARLADTFIGLRVTVLGDPLLYAYLEGQREQLCREAPPPRYSSVRLTTLKAHA